MDFADLTPNVIETLNQIALDYCYDFCVKLPSKDEVEKLRDVLAKHFPDEKYSHRDFAVRVLIALEYAKSRVPRNTKTMLDDIKAGKHIEIENYIKAEEYV